MTRRALALVLLLAAAPPLWCQVVISEIHYHARASEGRSLEFIEVHNPSPAAVALGGWRLTGGIEFTFPDGETLEGGGRRVLCKDCDVLRRKFPAAAAFFAGAYRDTLENAGERVALLDPFNAVADSVVYDDELPWPEGADGEGASLERLCPEASGRDPLNWSASDPPTPGAPNPAQRCPPPPFAPPPVVLSEIHYHPRTDLGVHPALQDGEEEEFVELFNRSTEPVDLGGWKLADGVGFIIPAGTVLGPGEYLAVCRDAEQVRARFGIQNAIGDFDGKLSNSGERVALVDGRGLLVDSVLYSDHGEWPYGADGAGRSLEKPIPEAPSWDAVSWRLSGLIEGFQRLEGEGRIGQGLSQKFLISIDGPGEALVDEVVCEDMARPGVNLVPNGSFDGSLQGWTAAGIAAGSTFAAGEGSNASGALRVVATGSCPSGECGLANSVSASLPAGIDRNARYRVSILVRNLRGSPFLQAGLFRGAGVAVRVLASPGKGPPRAPLPPFVAEVHRFPREPRSSDRVRISAQVRAAGTPAVRLRFAGGEVTADLPMFDDGLHRDRLAGDGVFGAELPAFPHHTQVRFRIEAALDGLVGGHPLVQSAGEPLPQEVDGYYVNDFQPDSVLPVYQVLVHGLEGADPDALNALLNCDVLQKGSLAFKGDLYPDVGVRFRGNTACFVYKKNLKLELNRGRSFRGLRKLNFNGLYTDKALVREHLAWEFLRGIGTPYLETEYVRVHLNGEYHGLFLRLEHPDERFLDRNGLDGGGNLYKSREPDFTASFPVGVSPQPSVEAYKRRWEAETNENGDYTDVAAFIDAMHLDGRTPGGPTVAFWQDNAFEEMLIGYQVGQVVLNNIDSFAKNHFLYHDLQANRWGFFAWDLDLTFGKFFTPEAVGPGRPVGTLNDLMLSDPGNGPELNPWFGSTVEGEPLLLHLVDLFLRAGRNHYHRAYLIRLWDALEEKYRSEAYDPLLGRLYALLEEEEALDHDRWGRYPSNVSGFPEDMRANIEVIKRQIRLHREFLRAYIRNRRNDVVTHPRLKITEIQYWPERGDDDLEFIEVLNTSGRPVDISGWTTDGVAFTFPAATVIAAGEKFLIARSPADLAERYGAEALPRVFGPYAGRLANEGEEIRILDAGPGHPATIDSVRYRNEEPWPAVDPGRSIELWAVAPDRDNDEPGSWIASGVPGGTPQRNADAAFIRGDSNFDQEVGIADPIFLLTYLFLGGQPSRCEDAADANDDGGLEISDVISLLTHLFLGGSAPPAPYPSRGTDPTPDPLVCAG